MIIVEGPDGSGKSTLVESLITHFELREGARGTTDRKKLYTVTVKDTYLALMKAIRAMRGVPVEVWDRLFYSEFVYYRYGNRPCEFSEGQRRFINWMIEAITCPVILCLPPPEVIIENAKKVDQMDGVNENLPQIIMDYHSMSQWMPPQTIIYDYTRDDTFKVFGPISAYLARREAREW